MNDPHRIEPGPGQESVWDYPRPPRVEASPRTVRVMLGGVEIARSDRTMRVLETAGAPTYYIPPEDVPTVYLVGSDLTSWCEWKGEARYFDAVAGGSRSEKAAWSYPDPKPEFEAIKNFVAFYPGRVEACYLDDELVRPQPGKFYGGWVTDDIVGPVKGEPGSEAW